MATTVHPLADVAPEAELGDDVFVGPFCIVGPHVQLGAGSRLDSHVVLTGHAKIGSGNRFFPNCVIGAEPQDYSYSGSPTRVEIGDGNIFREGVTVNRAAEKEDHVTRIGNNNLLMANCHIAHNCWVHNNTCLVNGVLLGGHVHVHDWAIISGNTVVHHYATVGTIAFVSGGCRVPTDIPPYMLSTGNDNPTVCSVNIVGMQRRGISAESIAVIRTAHKLIYRQHMKLAEVRDAFRAELGDCLPIELMRLLDFIERQQAGKSGRAGEVRRAAPPSTAPSEEIRRAA
jgi:UDP-N-acetylglucosamine acyltransferase